MNGGDLKFHIYNVGTRGLAMDRVVFYSAQMTCAVLHLHALGIVYRDLKPENVLLDDLGNCRLSDLGLAVQIQDDKPVTQRVSGSLPAPSSGLGEEGSRLLPEPTEP